MNKSLMATALALTLGVSANTAHAINMNSASFTMLDGTGGQVGLDNSVTGSIDFTAGTWSVASTVPFFGFNWVAHTGTLLNPGTHSIDTVQGGVYTGVQVGANQQGSHILFDWGAPLVGSPCGLANCDIDVVTVWDISNNGDGTVTYTSTDGIATNPVNPDGIRGYGMLDGAFLTFNANFDFIIPAPPTANADTKSTPVNTSTNIDLVANDSAAATTNGDTASVTPAVVPPAVVTAPASSVQGGTIVDNGDGSINYTPPAGYSGPDSFTYTLTDDAGRISAPATVSITVTVVANTPPVANDTALVTDEDTAINIAVNSVATDADGDSLTFATFDATSTQGGSVTVDGTNTTLTYTPATNFNGTDTFTFTVSDGVDSSNVATVTMTVNPINDPVVCTDVTLSTGLDTPLDIDVNASLLSTCNDPDGDTITLDSTTQPVEAGATLSFDGLNTLTYTPPTGFQGQDSFTYTATDGTVTDTRTVQVNVSGKIFGNFTMLDGDGVTFGGTNDIVFTWDNTCYNSVAEADAGPVNMTMGSDSSFPFFGFPWFAHDIKVFCPGGPYVFDTCNPGVTPPKCGDLSMTVPAGHLGAHILFDWNVTDDIDVAIVWNNSTGGMWQNVVPTGQLYQGPTGPTPALDEFYDWISVDADGDGVPGIQFTDGPFINFRANFNFKTSQSGGGNVTAPKSSIQSPNLGSTAGCTLSHTPVNPLDRSGWLVIAGLIAWLGFGRQCRRQIH